MDVAAGTMVTPKLRLVRLLGEGGMGSVWLADHLSLGTQVAVKFVSAEAIRSGGPQVLERFNREARAAAKISSPHVTHVYDFAILPDGTPYIVMELLHGETLGARLARSRHLALPETALLISQVSKALQEAHQLGIVHRDIKPDNIFLLTVAGEVFVKVLDFGIAKQEQAPGYGSLTGTRATLGTPEYMSPEQLLTPRKVDSRTDLWALGVVAYHLVTGQVPFSGDTLAALTLAICERPFEPPHELRPMLPAALGPWFARALSKDPAGRFESAQELASAFARACDVRASLLDRDELLRTPSSSNKARDDAWSRPEWVVRASKGSAEVGPVSLDQIFRGLKAGRVPPDAAVARVGSSDWELGSVVIVKAAKPSAPPPPLASHPIEPHGGTVPGHAPIERTVPAAPPGAGSTEVMAGAPLQPTFGGAASTLSHSGERSRARHWVGSGGIAAVAVVLAAGVVLAVWTGSDEESSADAEQGSSPVKTETAAPATASTRPHPLPSSMVAVPGGSYQLGCDDRARRKCYADEKPVHSVVLEPFAIMRYEVTVADYYRCVADGACPQPTIIAGCGSVEAHGERQPVTCVTWQAAGAFCAHQRWRLPSEAEWEAAARGRERHEFSWGQTAPSCDLTVLADDDAPGCGAGRPLEVGSRPADISWIGAIDMAGNVREWTSSRYAAYPGGNADEARDGYVNRGGSYLMKATKLSAAYTREVDPPNTARPDLGFRCAMSQ